MPVYLNRKDFAAYRGVSRMTVYNYIAGGKIKKALKTVKGKEMIDRDIADRELSQNLDTRLNRGTKPPPHPPSEAPQPESPPARPKAEPEVMEAKTKEAGTAGLTMADAQRLQAQYKAALLKLDYEERSGKLVKVETVDRDFFNAARMVRDAILNIPSRISADLANDHNAHSVSEKLTAELIQALEDLARDKLKGADG